MSGLQSAGLQENRLQAFSRKTSESNEITNLFVVSYKFGFPFNVAWLTHSILETQVMHQIELKAARCEAVVFSHANMSYKDEVVFHL